MRALWRPPRGRCAAALRPQNGREKGPQRARSAAQLLAARPRPLRGREAAAQGVRGYGPWAMRGWSNAQARLLCAPTRPKRAPADLAAAAPPTPEELEQERLLQEQRAQWAQTAHVEALCALFTGQIYKGQVEKEGYEVVLHDPLPGRYTRKA